MLLLTDVVHAGSDLTIQDIERILHYMVIESMLREQFEVQQPYGTVVAYMQVQQWFLMTIPSQAAAG